MSDFPTALLAGKEDSAQFNIEVENVAHASKMEGGYVISRPKFTRTPRKMFTTGFTFITQAQYEELVTFYETKFGGSDTFTYTDPASAVEYTVRFSPDYELKAKYKGAGATRRWDVHGIMLEEQ